VDLAPTLLDAAGIEPVPTMEGRSTLPLMEGAVEEFRTEVFSAITYHRHFLPTRAIRTSRYKLIRNLDSEPVGLGQLGGFEWAHAVCDLRNQPWLLPRIPAELYDLDVDPHEQTNLIDSAEHFHVRDDLLGRLHRHMQSVYDELLDLWDDYVPR
jgi:arylsulfatase A-like enzyme